MRHATLHALPALLLLATACGERSTPPAAVRAPPPAADPVAEAAASYRVTAAVAPGAVARGARGTLAVEISMARPDVHVQEAFPLKVALAPSAGLTLAKEALGHGDAVDPRAKGRRWEVAVTAKAPGAQEVQATLRFAICKETAPEWCVTRSETLRAAVEVR